MARVKIALKVLVIVTVFFLLVTSTALAANYFVDATNGNDENGGLSPDKAWETIKKVNNQTFYPGDSIRFKKGETWEESLFLDGSGEDGNVITLTSYGDADGKPIINGGNNDHSIKLLNNIHIMISRLDIQNGYESSLYLENCSHILIFDCLIHGAQFTGNVLTLHCKDVEIMGCKIYNSEYCGILMWNSDGFKIRDCFIYNNTNVGIWAVNDLDDSNPKSIVDPC